MEKGASIDWDVVDDMTNRDLLAEYLLQLPRQLWSERDFMDRNFFGYARCGSNEEAIVALIASKAIDLNAYAQGKNAPLHLAAACNLPRAIELLCAAGANVHVRDGGGRTPLDRALAETSWYGDTNVRVLLANGVRLSTVAVVSRCGITPELVAFERGVLRCRSAAVALMRVRRAGKLVRWDKFLLREMAIAVWATRYSKEWQK